MEVVISSFISPSFSIDWKEFRILESVNTGVSSILLVQGDVVWDNYRNSVNIAEPLIEGACTMDSSS